MASYNRSFLLPLSILLTFLAVTAVARPGRHFHPCKSILFISSSSSYHHLDQNPNFSIRNPNDDQFTTFFITHVDEINHKPSPLEFDQIPIEKSAYFYSSSVGSSIHDRTMDIMSVVGALLFGLGCGVLTAAVMYLIWSLFAPPRSFQGYFDDEFYDDDSDSEDDDDDASPKKFGYASIPAAKEVV